jgi:hypothetical protein
MTRDWVSRLLHWTYPLQHSWAILSNDLPR